MSETKEALSKCLLFIVVTILNKQGILERGPSLRKGPDGKAVEVQKGERSGLLFRQKGVKRYVKGRGKGRYCRPLQSGEPSEPHCAL